MILCADGHVEYKKQYYLLLEADEVSRRWNYSDTINGL